MLDSKVPLRIYNEVVELENEGLDSCPYHLDNVPSKLESKLEYDA